MTIDLEPAVETMLASLAEERGTTPEQLALEILTQRIKAKIDQREPRDEFERLLREVGTPCGIALSDEDLSREEMYN